MVEYQSAYKWVGTIKFKSDNIDLFTHLVILFWKVHFQLIDIVWNSLVFPWADLEGVEALEVNTANRSLTKNHCKWELIWVIERNETHWDAVTFTVRHVELDYSVRLFTVYWVNSWVIPSNYSITLIFKVDKTSYIMTNEIPLGTEYKSHLILVLSSFTFLWPSWSAIHIHHTFCFFIDLCRLFWIFASAFNCSESLLALLVSMSNLF